MVTAPRTLHPVETERRILQMHTLPLKSFLQLPASCQVQFKLSWAQLCPDILLCFSQTCTIISPFLLLPFFHAHAF